MSPRDQTELYFAYGSNLNRGDMRRRCPGARPSIPARLRGWRLTFRGVADVEPAPDLVVHGALWSLTGDDVCNLDSYEGAPSLYRQKVLVVEAGDACLEAMTYVMAKPAYLGLPSPWYLERIAVGYRDWGLPEEALRAAVEDTQTDLAARGVIGFRQDGRKRLRAILDEASA